MVVRAALRFGFGTASLLAGSWLLRALRGAPAALGASPAEIEAVARRSPHFSDGAFANIDPASGINLDGEEQRCLAFRHGLQEARVLGVPVGQGRQLLRVFQQELEPVPARHGVEVIDDLLQPGIEGVSGHGLSPRVMGTRTLFPHSVHDPS